MSLRCRLSFAILPLCAAACSSANTPTQPPPLAQSPAPAGVAPAPGGQGATSGAGSSAAEAGAIAGMSARAGAGAAAAQGAAGAIAAGSGGGQAVPKSGAGSSAAGASAGSPAAGAPAVAGSPAAGSGGAPAPGAGKVFSQCRFHFGAIADVVRNNAATVRELDFFTPGWMGLKDQFDMQHVCDDTKPGATFAGKVPAIVSYVSAFYAKRTGNLKDCNAQGAMQDLCTAGAQIIRRDLSKIVAIYENYAQGFANCYGTERPIIFMMEPDFYQYTISQQSQPWTAAQAGETMTQFVKAIQKYLPNAAFSMDVSPWVAPDNGSDNGKQWFSNFDLSLFTFINTSGGSTDGGGATIRGSNKMTWRGVHGVTGKPLLADTGYGVNGRSEGPDAVWDDPNNINARIDDGVTSISQYNPASDWGAKIAGIRSKLKATGACP